jgi:uncharacterized protein
MKTQSPGKHLRVFVGESDKHGRKPLYQAIVELLRGKGMAGATVLRGIEGFGAASVLHKTHLLHISDDLPLAIEVADHANRIEEALPELEAMVPEGLITLENIELITYRRD